MYILCVLYVHSLSVSFVHNINCNVMQSFFRREETIFLDVHARSVRPSLIVASQHGMTKMDFGKVVVGELLSSALSDMRLTVF